MYQLIIHKGVYYGGYPYWTYPYNDYYYSWYNYWPAAFTTVGVTACNVCPSACPGTCGTWSGFYACQVATCPISIILSNYLINFIKIFEYLIQKYNIFKLVTHAIQLTVQEACTCIHMLMMLINTFNVI
jgi:hypothetical protein